MIGINNVEIDGFGTYNITFNDTWREGDYQSLLFIEAAGAAFLRDWTGTGIFQGNDYDLGSKTTRGCELNFDCLFFTVNMTVPGTSVLQGGAFDNLYGGNDSRDGLISLFGFAEGDTNVAFLSYEQVGGEIPPAVPVPAALFMFAPALLGFMGLRRRVKNTAV
ncbi:MAG: hypothetical protein ACKE9I_03055 [Methylophagaceae bacterium]